MDNVSQTLFYPLLGRALASRQWPDLFPDPWARQAEEIARKEGTTAKAMEGFPTIIYGLRHRISVLEITRYLEERPGAAVVNSAAAWTASPKTWAATTAPSTTSTSPTS